MAQKPTKAEYEKRVTEIYQLLICGTSRVKIVQYASKKWGISNRQGDDMIAAARKQTILEQDVTRQEALAEELSLRNFLLTSAIKEKRWATALQVSDSRAKLRGLAIATDQEVMKEYKDRKLDEISDRADD